MKIVYEFSRKDYILTTGFFYFYNKYNLITFILFSLLFSYHRTYDPVKEHLLSFFIQALVIYFVLWLFVMFLAVIFSYLKINLPYDVFGKHSVELTDLRYIQTSESIENSIAYNHISDVVFVLNYVLIIRSNIKYDCIHKRYFQSNEQISDFITNIKKKI